jgi:hypothetical protein
MNKIIRMQEDIQQPAQPEVDMQNVPVNTLQEFMPFMSNTLTDPTTRLLQEIRFLLVILVVLKIICILKKKQ